MGLKLYLIRGLPGSGKTTLARIIAPFSNYAADDYYGETPDGGYVYPWSRETVSKAHALCQRRVKVAMENNVPVIAVHNTFTKLKEMEPYYELAITHGYLVSEIVMTNDFGSKHGVPQETIETMRARWEWR